jgi:D-alanine-D-alanine ligase
VNVVILYDAAAVRPQATPDARGVLEAVEAVRRALLRLGHAVTDLSVGERPIEALDALASAGPDLVFNLCESVDGDSAREASVMAAVELLGLRCTGSPSETLALSRRKDRLNPLLAAAGRPVPDWTLACAGSALEWSAFPAIVKPAGEDASIGVTQASVVTDSASLAAALESGRTLGHLLVQRYLPGREFNVGIVGDRVLPVAEIDFAGLAASLWPIVSYRAKWLDGCDEDRGTVSRCPAALDSAAAACAVDLARTAWRVAEGRGYGRVDLRTDADGRFHVLEVNPNPDLAPGAGLARMAQATGWRYVDLIDRIVTEAIA